MEKHSSQAYKNRRTRIKKFEYSQWGGLKGLLINLLVVFPPSLHRAAWYRVTTKKINCNFEKIKYVIDRWLTERPYLALSVGLALWWRGYPTNLKMKLSIQARKAQLININKLLLPSMVGDIINNIHSNRTSRI